MGGDDSMYCFGQFRMSGIELKFYSFDQDKVVFLLKKFLNLMYWGKSYCAVCMA